MVKKLEAQGGLGEEVWDDGVHEKVTKVYVGQGATGVAYVKFLYKKDGLIVVDEHGSKTMLGAEEFEIDPDDYLTSVTVYYTKRGGFPTGIITGLEFKTFKGKTSRTYGFTSDLEAELGGGEIVGFHGSSDCVIYSLGAYIVPSNYVPAQGGDAGVPWDDGVYDGVKKIYIGLGQGESGVTFFKAEYEKDSKPVLGSDHGKMSKLGLVEFELGPGEYVTAVTGYYDHIFVDAPVIVSLKFKTNKRVFMYGSEAGTEFVLHKKDHKIVGFYGQAGDYLYKLGAHVAPIAN